MKRFIYFVFLAALATLFAHTHAQQKVQPDTKQVPQKVLDGLRARFPNAQIDKWTMEKESDIVIYDFEFTQDGHKFEADVREDGTIYNWEKAIAAKDLPAAVRNTVKKMYPQAGMKDIMEIRAVKEGKDHLEGYEIVLITVDKKEVEVTVAPDGKLLENSEAGK